MQHCAGMSAHLWVEGEPAGLVRLCARCARFSQPLQDARPLLLRLQTHLLPHPISAACRASAARLHQAPPIIGQVFRKAECHVLCWGRSFRQVQGFQARLLVAAAVERAHVSAPPDVGGGQQPLQLG